MEILMEVDRSKSAQQKPHGLVSEIWAGWLQEQDLQRLVEHPLLIALASGEASPETLKTFLAQHSHYSRHFTRYLCALIGQLGDSESIRALLENLQEEMGVDGDGQMTHAEMFQRTLRVVGVVPADHEPLPATLQLRNTMMAHCKSSDPLAGLAAMCLGAEAIVPVIYQPVLLALQKSGHTEEATEFFRLHIEEDEDHALTMLALMRQLTNHEPERFEFAVRVGRELIARRVEMFDAVWQACQQYEAATQEDGAAA
ncbi:TenA family transcriptional regulator [Burkholderia glumae]|nr:iron-containing redox enzyme family protein [Burkholderia glumae]AJY64055.1 TENA/THI-4/PQQC family protein [Burkholderia glumae LMG 2196 = ATCC 33617]QKM56588.1 PqqC-like protein [Burkholderia glumae]QTP36262.1 PqqC-like protein [Burkholderia glumae]